MLQFNYHFVVQVWELLAITFKAQRNRTEQEEIREVTSDMLGMFKLGLQNKMI